jgi:hypothetical protein
MSDKSLREYALQRQIDTLEARVHWLEDAMAVVLGGTVTAAQDAQAAAVARDAETAAAIGAGADGKRPVAPLLERFLLRTQPMRIDPAALGGFERTPAPEASAPGAAAPPFSLDIEPGATPAPATLAPAAAVVPPTVQAAAPPPRAPAAAAEPRYSKPTPPPGVAVPVPACAPAADIEFDTAALDAAMHAPYGGTELKPVKPAKSEEKGINLSFTAAFDTLDTSVDHAANEELEARLAQQRRAAPAITINPELAETARMRRLTRRKLDVRCSLEERHPSILQQLLVTWRKPESLTYLRRLILQDQGGRLGFDPFVKEEIVLLCALREEEHEAASQQH